MTHTGQVLGLLRTQGPSDSEVKDIEKTAAQVSTEWVVPRATGKESINGLIYGLVQSGKTGVLTVTGAMGVDAGYDLIVLLTSDIDPLYAQTLGRAQEAFPGMDVIGKHDIHDPTSLLRRLKKNPCCIVMTKNSRMLGSITECFKQGNLRKMSCLLIDDEADQASLDTQVRKTGAPPSPINAHISELRNFFHRNTYLQVTATPQALFLQDPTHAFRPQFTVLSHPGSEYVGGEDFFSDGSTLVREFDIGDLLTLAPGSQPRPSTTMPKSLLLALDTFMIGATFKRTNDKSQNCAFLCHVSTKTADHKHIEDLLQVYKTELGDGVKSSNKKVLLRLRAAFDELAKTDASLAKADFDDLVATIGFLATGIVVKTINGQSDKDVAMNSPYNLFVGGNKLGRGVTIKNLLVSYYGRNPKTPQADTVLQHARMYGYRRKDIGLLRLFVPNQLHMVFKAIYNMERGLRDLIAKNPSETFRGVYLSAGVAATRKSVLLPGSIGVYTAASNYNPAQVVRDARVIANTAKADALLKNVEDGGLKKVTIDELIALLDLTLPDSNFAEHVWNSEQIKASIKQLSSLVSPLPAMVYVSRNRDSGVRGETRGILSGGEASKIPQGTLALFMLRTKVKRGEEASWWPQIRFPSGNYAFAFAI